MKARRYQLRPRALAVVLRHHDFHHDGLEARLNRPTASTLEAIPLIRHLFDRLFKPGCRYRSTMLIMGKLETDTVEQLDLFDDRTQIEGYRRVTGAIDAISKRYGKHALCSGTALDLDRKQRNHRDEDPERRQTQELPGETPRQRLAIPRLDIKI